MKSFQSLFCAEHQRDEDRFLRHVLRLSLHRHARPLGLFLGGYGSDYCAIDRDLVRSVGRSTNVVPARDETAHFFRASGYHSFRRPTLDIRLSTTRLKARAKQQLTGADRRPPIGGLRVPIH